jgi:hypothetical protein
MSFTCKEQKTIKGIYKHSSRFQSENIDDLIALKTYEEAELEKHKQYSSYVYAATAVTALISLLYTSTNNTLQRILKEKPENYPGGSYNDLVNTFQNATNAYVLLILVVVIAGVITVMNSVVLIRRTSVRIKILESVIDKKKKAGERVGEKVRERQKRSIEGKR